MSTIAAIATPAGAGGIGVIRVSGPQAIAVADRVFFAYSKKKLSQIPGYTALYGKVLAGDEMLDEVVALLFRAPKSYTGEDVVELSCHGGSYVLSRVLRLLFAGITQGVLAAAIATLAYQIYRQNQKKNTVS